MPFVVFLLGSVIIIVVRFLNWSSYSCVPAQTQICSGKYIYETMLLRVCNLPFGLVPDHLEHLPGSSYPKATLWKPAGASLGYGWRCFEIPEWKLETVLFFL